jgi:hypothetical protein
MARRFDIQLADIDGEIIQSAGGMVTVCTPNTPDQAAIGTSPTGAQAITNNPVALNRGKMEFYTADEVDTVDLYIMTPTGHSLVKKGVKASGPNEIKYDTMARTSVAVIPFSHADSTATTEQDTGVDLPTGALVTGAAIQVVDIDATETLDVGTATAESGDPNGFLAAVSVASAVMVKGTLANGATTLGALLFVQDSANAGDEAPEPHVVVSTARSVTYTTSAGSDTCSGFILLPYILPAV